MADRENVVKEKIDHSGIFDFKAVYSFAHSWLKDEDYGVVEDKYSEKISGNSRDIGIEWSVKKEINEYLRMDWAIEFEVKGLTDVEVEIDGERKRMNKGKISITIKSAIVTDAENKWEANPFYKMLRDFYDKFIIPHRIKKTKDKIEEDVKSFKEEIKALLELSGRR